MLLRDQLKGTGVALVTPFTADNRVDYDALARLIQFVIDGGVQYLVTLGTTGESVTLTNEEKKEIIRFTCSTAAGRLPVVVGIGGNNTQSVIRGLETLPLEGAAAVLSASPYYNKPSQEGIFQHYKALAAVSPRPIILYNVPGRTASNITAATTLRLAREVENIVGIKEASGNMVQCMHILRDRPGDFLVTSGDDHLTLPLIACGMDGVISVAANCFPKDFSALVQCALRGEYVRARALQSVLLTGFDLLFAENNPAGVKAFLHELGLMENVLRLPLVPLSAPIHEQVKSFLATLK
ncbi:MAG TPA: 4-hydroxy-tetrahydrodipicolinate synthase [Chitinophagaceae bacterium]|jgi:4-hydroxy-tetrahydrodipicolinate synthase|nr:4-hydroxy-tetrahydrodipicolinate synthase [Chitinophagaceae bacterium]